MACSADISCDCYVINSSACTGVYHYCKCQSGNCESEESCSCDDSTCSCDEVCNCNYICVEYKKV